MACLGPALSPRLACHRTLLPAPPGGQAHGRATLMRSRLPQGSLACCKPVGRRVWRLAAAAEPQAVEDQPARTEGSAEASAAGGAEASSKLVLVVGGTGGVGQLVVASLLSRKIKSRLLLRDPEKAVSLFGKQDESILKVYKGDTRNPNDLDPQMFEIGMAFGICVMNLFGVLKYKKMAEDLVRSSGIPFTIIRPGRLTDGPYTSYDLNTLLKATAGERRAVVIGKGDKLVGEVSRLVVAEACIQALDIEFTEGQIYEINSVKGEGPGADPEKWTELFRSAQST
ncbi:hypothetical protein PR202_ga25729 [Eleusine coracana subsp. coracana]|uniref:NAD(P)-binding domain-containing protein n=1 Tax=Eleusine coracana subsp. coracana TaxID=191504 RepID=A0AAV5DBR9_ELECO|nr:hypothetical protein PR202_ga25729 [Eleusine coracana subsp. coracana]